jgi:charged multivesicular body protein 4
MNLFGRKKQDVKVQPNVVITDLGETVKMLEKREVYLDKQISMFRNQALTAVKAKNKPKALAHLKKAKMLEKQLESIFGMKFNIELQIGALAQSITGQEVYKALVKGKDALAKLDTQSDPDKVADVMDDLAETMSKVDEVSQVMSPPIGQLMDDDELTKELDNMMMELEVSPEVQMPNIPTKTINIRQKEEEELKALQLMMN